MYDGLYQADCIKLEGRIHYGTKGYALCEFLRLKNQDISIFYLHP